MASRKQTSPEPKCWRLGIDDVGEFDLWVLAPGSFLPHGRFQGLQLDWELSMQRGPRWAVRSGSGQAPMPRPSNPMSSSPEGPQEDSQESAQSVSQSASQSTSGEVDLSDPCEFWIGPQRIASRRPAEGSTALHWSTHPPAATDPEAGWLFLPLDHEILLGPRKSAMPVEDWEEGILLRASEAGLSIACAGGIRMADGEGTFDEPQPERSISAQTDRATQLWCVARPGPPVFLTLEPRSGSAGGPSGPGQGLQ